MFSQVDVLYVKYRSQSVRQQQATETPFVHIKGKPTVVLGFARVQGGADGYFEDEDTQLRAIVMTILEKVYKLRSKA